MKPAALLVAAVSPLLVSASSPPSNDVGSLLVQRPRLNNLHKQTLTTSNSMEPSYFFEDMPLIAAKPVEKPVSLTKG